VEKLFVLDTLIPEPPGHPRAMKHLSGEVPEGRINLASEDLGVFISEGIMKEPGSHPTSYFPVRFPPLFRPIPQNPGYPNHMLPSAPSRFRPTRKDTPSGLRKDGVEGRIGGRQGVFQIPHPSRM